MYAVGNRFQLLLGNIHKIVSRIFKQVIFCLYTHPLTVSASSGCDMDGKRVNLPMPDLDLLIRRLKITENYFVYSLIGVEKDIVIQRTEPTLFQTFQNCPLILVGYNSN